jgi:hypothetical protein
LKSNVAVLNSGEMNALWHRLSVRLWSCSGHHAVSHCSVFGRRRANSGVPGAHGHLRNHGVFYFLKPGTAKLPRFERGKPVSSVYTNVLQVPARDFREGFPGVTDRNG